MSDDPTDGTASHGDEPEGSHALRELRRGYRSTGVILLNTVLLVVLLNAVLGVYYLAADSLAPDPGNAREVDRLFTAEGAPVDNGKRLENQLYWYDFSALEGIDREHAAQVLDDYYELSRTGVVYQSWVQFSPPPFDGELIHVDVDSRGFPLRRTPRDAPERERKDVVKIFALGGSTTFGEEVSDGHTWPSHLSEILRKRAREQGYPHRIEVSNYGRPHYHPAQEVALLSDLLRTGHRPSLVIFMDGVNLGGPTGEPHYKPEIARALIDRQHGPEVTRAAVARELRWVPMVRFALAVDHWLDRRLRSGRTNTEEAGGLSEEAWQERVHRAENRFEESRAMARHLCEMYGCQLLTFLQPNPLVRYDPDLYRADLPTSFTSRIGPVRKFYDRMRRDTGYVDLSHLFEEWGTDRKAVLDDLHYTPGFGRFLARRVADHVELADLPVFDGVIDDEAASASPRSLVTRDGWLRPEDDWEFRKEGSR